MSELPPLPKPFYSDRKNRCYELSYSEEQMQAYARAAIALAAPTAPAPTEPVACQTCNNHGMIGGPSFYAPDEGGVPCPDCATPPSAVEAAQPEAVREIPEPVLRAIRQAGFTLLKTQNGYQLVKLGQVVAQAAAPTTEATSSPSDVERVAMVLRAARELCRIHAGECQVNEQDTWNLYAEQFKRDADAVLRVAIATKGGKL